VNPREIANVEINRMVLRADASALHIEAFVKSPLTLWFGRKRYIMIALGNST
jgi:hypothetical protein